MPGTGAGTVALTMYVFVSAQPFFRTRKPVNNGQLRTKEFAQKTGCRENMKYDEDSDSFGYCSVKVARLLAFHPGDAYKLAVVGEQPAF